MKRLKRLEMKMLAIMLLFIVAMNGCGKAGSEKQGAKGSSEKRSAKTENFAEEASEFKYIELTEIEDYYGDKSMYEVYAPKECRNEDGFVRYSGHGLIYTAFVYSFNYEEGPAETLEYSIELDTEGWGENEDSQYKDVDFGEMQENGEDIYQLVTAKMEDYEGTPFDVNHFYYMDIQENGAGILWEVELYEIDVDSDTNLILDELAECYHVDLDIVKASGEYALIQEARINEERMENTLPETILWFNATYAPLTYSNDCDWEEVGGMDATDYNMEFLKKTLNRDWGIEDADSAMETIENLKENGHRAKCRECMEELERLGILEERNEEKFLQALLNSGIEENLYRYVFAYELHWNGLDENYIAAWDLCRVNQLYADFYICGYMTYEEAMDASLENSVILQKMYPSWKEMVTSYLAGYQFWRSDPMLTDDSPTLQRYQCYLDLLEMENGPYTLDWNMKLEKSW